MEELREEEVGVKERVDKGRMEELREEEVGVKERVDKGRMEELREEEVGVKERVDKGRMEELREEEVGVKQSLTKKLVGNRLRWAGHVERMEGVQLTKRADAVRVKGRRRIGRPGQRWENCVKRDLAGVGGEWRIWPRDGWEWRRVVETAVKRD